MTAMRRDCCGAYAIGEGPDIFHAAHEWICAFAEPGFLFDLTDFTNDNPQFFGDIFPSLWASTECGGRRFAVPQDAEARMFFFNKNLMRQAGFSDEEIESLDDRVLAGEVTLDDMSGIAQQVVENTDAEYGILHRPSRGPDYLMIFNQYGSSFVDPETGKLLLEEDKLAAAYGWFERNVQNGVTPGNNTSLEWNFIRDQFYQDNNAAMWMYGVWDLGSSAFPLRGAERSRSPSSSSSAGRRRLRRRRAANRAASPTRSSTAWERASMPRLRQPSWGMRPMPI